MFTIRHCETDKDFARAGELEAELAAWDAAEAQKLGIPTQEMTEFYYPTEREAAGSGTSARGATLLAFAGSIPAACIGFRELDPHLCELKRFYVRPGFRGSGLGTLMISSLVERAALAGYSHMCLETTRFMGSAVRLYEEAGFVPCEAYYPIPERFRHISIFMKKELGAPVGMVTH